MSDDELEVSGLSENIDNGRHRLLRELISETLTKLNHVGLNTEDQAYFAEFIVSQVKGGLIPSFAETIEKNEQKVRELEQKLSDFAGENVSVNNQIERLQGELTVANQKVSLAISKGLKV